MSDQPLTEDELKELLQAVSPGEFPVNAERIRRLVTEVRERRAKERPPIKHSILKQVADRGDDHFSMGIITGFLAEYERLGLVQRVNDGSAWSLTDAGRKHLETTFDTSENYWSW